MRDPLAADSDAPEHVLVPVVARNHRVDPAVYEEFVSRIGGGSQASGVADLADVPDDDFEDVDDDDEVPADAASSSSHVVPTAKALAARRNPYASVTFLEFVLFFGSALLPHHMSGTTAHFHVVVYRYDGGR